jgi:N-acetylglucosaminyldiphosphoundecaprenol N-acetyl-beta-D-mannosaminyltransferase
VTIQGIDVAPLTVAGLLDRIAALIHSNRRATVAYVNVHVLNEAARHPDLTAFLAGADVCYADGNGVVLAARLLGQALPGRMTGADWIHDLAARAATDGWRLGWIGGAPGVTQAAAGVLEAAHPGVQFVWLEHGFHEKSGPANDAVLQSLAEARPDVLLVGMGTPTQERWVAENRDRMECPVVWCVGATADFVSGTVNRGPRVLYENQEWLARLLVDPKRLWRRFLVGNPRFFARVLRTRLRESLTRP